MKVRLGLAALVIAVLVTGVAWLTVQPMLTSLYEANLALGGRRGLLAWESAVPALVGLDLVVSVAVAFLVLYLGFGLSLGRAGEALEELGPEITGVELTEGGSLVTRLGHAVRRLGGALKEQRASSQRRHGELKAANDALLRLQTELVSTDRLATVGKLAAGVAHEVGNPLAGILGYLSVVRMRAASDPELLDLAARIEHEVQRIDQIVRSLLELGRPSRGKAGPLAVRPVIDSCVQLLAAGREFRQVKIEVECSPSLYLRAEAGPLSQVLVNLLLNASQAMGERGELFIRAGASGERGFVSVTDRGPGIPSEVLPRLFEPFFTTRPAGQGTGLGLAVSRHLLSQFEGRLEAANAEGGGAVFTIDLPLP